MNLSYRNQINAEIVAAHCKKPLNKPEWFSINNLSSDSPEIFIYDFIGWPFNDAGELIRALSEMKDRTPTARINSPGGDVFDGFSIQNAFSSHPGGVNVVIEGLAASIASVIAMGGKAVSAYSNSMMMIHRSMSFIGGHDTDLIEIGELLSKIDNSIIDAYAGKTKLGKKNIREMLVGSTGNGSWMTAKEMKEKGFIDSIIDGKGAKAQFDLSMFANCPDDIRGEEKELTERDAERILRDAGFSRSKAKSLLAGRSTDDSGQLEAVAEKALSIFLSK